MAAFANKSKATGRVVFIIQFAKLNVYNGHTSVTSYFDSTKLFINTDIDEINDFRKSLVEKLGERESSSTMTKHSGKLYYEEEDFLINHEFKCISEILEPVEINKFIVVGTITGIRADYTWYYLACKNCNHVATVNTQPNTSNEGIGVSDKPLCYKCDNPKCKTIKIQVVPRFKIPIKVQDCTGLIVLSLFDRDGFKFLKQTAASFLSRYEEQLGLNSKWYPEEFNTLIGRKMGLKIESKPFNVEHNNNIYGVLKSSIDENIISELEKKLPKPQTQELIATTDEDLDSISGKECVSETGENITPSTFEKVSDNNVQASSPVEADLKRNLIQVYDVEEEDYGSTTKERQSGKHLAKGINLKIPKIEK